MINNAGMAHYFWVEAINTGCDIVNRVNLQPKTRKTPYEIWKGKKSTVSYFHIFGSECYILQDREQKAKFDSRCMEGIFLGYATHSKVLHLYNKHTGTVMESINVVVNDAREKVTTC